MIAINRPNFFGVAAVQTLRAAVVRVAADRNLLGQAKRLLDLGDNTLAFEDALVSQKQKLAGLPVEDTLARRSRHYEM